MSYNLVKNIFGSILCTTLAILVGLITFMPINVEVREVQAENRIESSVLLDTVTPTMYGFSGSSFVLPYTDKWQTNNSTWVNKLGSQIMLEVSFNDNSYNLPYLFVSVHFPFVNSSGFTKWSLLESPKFVYNNNLYNAYDVVNRQFVAINNGVETRSNVVNSGVTFSIRGTSLDLDVTETTSYWISNCYFQFDTTNDVTFDFIGCRVGSGAWDGSKSNNYLEYFAENDYYFRINFYNFDVYSPVVFESRTYYFGVATDGYNQGYADGKEAGLEDGFNQAVETQKQNWYNEGYSNGRNSGYSIGYNEGLENASDYTFLGLFGAMIDAPIQAFTGLLDFDVFGIDAKSLVLSLFTLCIVLVIIRLATKGGGN